MTGLADGVSDGGRVRVELPYHLRQMAKVGHEITLDVTAPVTAGGIIDALEATYPMLRGTIRDYGTGKRRPYLRFFACQQDVSFADLDAPVPDRVAAGDEPFMILGAIAGG